MILITGAGGKTGKAVLKALVTRGASVRAFVRNPAREAALKTIGAHDVMVGAMDDPQALARATESIEAIYHICPNVSPHEMPFATALIDAATGSGVSRLVYHLGTGIRRSRRCRITGTSCGSRKCCSAQGWISPSCNQRPICRTASVSGIAWPAKASTACPTRSTRG
ncbi:MAG: NAD(P)H-binding protein [Bradyrhizobium sp.]